MIQHFDCLLEIYIKKNEKVFQNNNLFLKFVKKNAFRKHFLTLTVFLRLFFFFNTKRYGVDPYQYGLLGFLEGHDGPAHLAGTDVSVLVHHGESDRYVLKVESVNNLKKKIADLSEKICGFSSTVVERFLHN